jgi:hypothetical protein
VPGVKSVNTLRGSLGPIRIMMIAAAAHVLLQLEYDRTV